MNQKKIEKIIKSLEDGYDGMSLKFSETRKYFWRGFEFIPNIIEDGDKFLDFGCGNGRILEILKDNKITYYGIDISGKLIDIAKKKYVGDSISFQKISGLDRLAFPDNFFNKIVSISVFHHFPKKYAEEVAKELYRIAKPDGKIIISVWNLWQGKYLKYIFNLFDIGRKIFRIGKFSGLGFFDVFIPFWDNKGDVFERYHFAFTKDKLRETFEQAGFKIENIFILNERNIILIAKK